MNKYLMMILWTLVLLSAVSAYEVVFSGIRLNGPLLYLYWGAFGAGFFSWLYLGIRFFVFRAKLVAFVKRIMDNEYETGIKIMKFADDEISCVSGAINKMADRLSAYDRLQRERITVISSAFDVLYSLSGEAIAVFDAALNEFRFNKRMQAIFEVEQETIAYGAIAKQSGNSEFIELLRSCVDKGRIISNAKVSLELPVRRTRRELVLSMTPVKNSHEIAELAVILAAKID